MSSVDLLPARVASDSNTFIEVLFSLLELVAIFLKDHLQKLHSPSLECENKHHIVDLLLLLIILRRLEYVNQLDDLGTHVPLLTFSKLLVQFSKVFPQYFDYFFQENGIFCISQTLQSS